MNCFFEYITILMVCFEGLFMYTIEMGNFRMEYQPVKIPV